MSNPADTFPEKISNLLQSSWDSATIGLQVTDVEWSHDKYETLTSIEKVAQKAIISTYNPANPVTIEGLSKETSFIHETVVVDVILHTAALGGTDSTIAIREKIRQFILPLLNSPKTVLAGADNMSVEGEYIRGELPQLQREAFKVVVSYFQVIPQ